MFAIVMAVFVLALSFLAFFDYDDWANCRRANTEESVQRQEIRRLAWNWNRTGGHLRCRYDYLP